jgi:DNA (cytosine-5)-methyltransferase 1
VPAVFNSRKAAWFWRYPRNAFFNIESILAEKRPRAFLLENVRRLTTHDDGRTLQIILSHLRNLGYTVHHTVFNSLHFGLPQKRERIYIVGFLEKVEFAFPLPLKLYKPLSEILEPDNTIDRSYFLSESIRAKRKALVKGKPPIPSIWHENIGGNISALPYSCALRAGGSYNYLVVNGERRLTSREMLRLQGFPDSFKIPLPYSQARKVAGNSVSVPVIEAIAAQITTALRKSKQRTLASTKKKVGKAA